MELKAFFDHQWNTHWILINMHHDKKSIPFFFPSIGRGMWHEKHDFGP